MTWLRAWLGKLGEKEVLVNAGWLYLDQGVRAGLVLVAFGAVARHLGPENYGLLSYATAFAGLFVPLAVLGLDYVVVMELVRNREGERRVLATTAGLKIGGAVLALLAAGGALLLVSADNPARGLLPVVLLSLGLQPCLIFDSWFQSRIASRDSVFARLAASVGANGARLVLVAADAPLVWFAWVFAIEAGLYGLGLGLVFRRAGGPSLAAWWRDFDRQLAGRLWRQAWPLFLADLAIVGYLKLDQLLLSHLAGPEPLGRYAAAYRLADAGEFLILALINSQFPRLVAAHAQEGMFSAVIGRFMRQMIWLAIGVAVGLSVVAAGLIRLVLGEQYAGAAVLLAMLSWANVFVTVIAVRGKWFLLEGLQRYSLVFFASGAALHLAGVLLTARWWGGLGAASSFLVAQGAMAMLLPWLFPATRPAALLALRSFWPVRG